MQFSNQQIAKFLREIAAAYTIKKSDFDKNGAGNIFEIRAYENAADSIEHSTSEIKDLWEEGKLEEIPGLGKKLQSYLDELFKTGKVKHFEDVQKGIPEIVFDLLNVPGVGPKTAEKVAELGVKDLGDLKKKLKSGELVNKGFSAKIAQKVLLGLAEVDQRRHRMLLPYAAVQADKILSYLKSNPAVLQVHPLGSLRRMVATVGDLDFSVSSNEPKEVIEYFCRMPGVSRIVDKGESKATVILKSIVQADLLAGEPDSYGALLQHLTGSKSHNIHLNELAKKNNLDISKCKTEEQLYKILGMQTPPPEIREDTGEIEAALAHKLPILVELKDIKGDLHLHSNFPIKSPSHGPGADSIEEIIEKAQGLGYGFVGISDHPPGFSTTSREEIIRWIEKRTKFIQSLRLRTKSIRVQHAESNTRSVRILNGLEIDILGDGSLSVPDEALAALDYCIAGIHSGHRGSKEEITKRLVKALENPHVDIISHPTNRLLNERESSEADWEQVFKVAAKNNKILEINAYPNRLDLRDDLVRFALGFGVKFIINTDAHQVSQMENMRFGIGVARRGWAAKKDIVNAWDWKNFAEWFKINL